MLKAGRWNNESEIVRYGLELVRREVEREDLSPLPEAVVAEYYAQMTPEEIEVDRRMGQASLKAQPKSKA